uniref:D-amino-acid transaminase n=1 Tax=Stappia sp. TaxID=1870903 RepID=UPI003BAB89D1
MSRVAYVNGRYVRHAEAAVHIEDRGYQFADGVYEVCEIWNGRIVDARRHLDRLERSLSELSIRMPMGRAALEMILREVVRRNLVHDGLVYIQVTRGVARRDHVFPSADTPPALVVTARSARPEVAEKAAEAGVGVISVPENRWDRVDIKTVGLLPNVLAKQKAKEAGAKEAWFIDRDGFVTEGGSTNAWIVTKDNVLVTRPADHGILKGITRQVVLDMVEKKGLAFEERPFTLEEAREAKEAFITAASTLVMPVVSLDGKPVGNGHPGEMSRDLRAGFHEMAESEPV